MKISFPDDHAEVIALLPSITPLGIWCTNFTYCQAIFRAFCSYRQASIESFKKDPDYAAEYLKAVLEYGDQEELMIALRCIAVAFGMKAIAETAKLNSKSLYSALFSAGNPELRSFQAIFGAMGIHLSVTPLVHEMKSANDFGLVV